MLSDGEKLFVYDSENENNTFLSQGYEELDLQSYCSGKTHLKLYRAKKRLVDDIKGIKDQIDPRSKILQHVDRLANLGTLCSSIAHELNNPMTFISGNVETLEMFWKILNDKLDVLRQHYPEDSDDIDFIGNEMPEIITSMKKGVKRMISLLYRFSDFARNHGSAEERYEKVILSRRVDIALDLCQKYMRNRIKIITDYTDELVQIKCIPQQIEHVLINLIINAADAMSGRKESELRFRVYSDNDNAYLDIADNGPGISNDMLECIWEPFITTKIGRNGTGLGLPIVKSIVDAHDGTISITNTDPGVCVKIAFSKAS